MKGNSGCLGPIILTVIVISVLAVLIQLVLFVGAAMGIAGIAYGGAIACKNYGLAFKHNVIDPNQNEA